MGILEYIFIDEAAVYNVKNRSLSIYREEWWYTLVYSVKNSYIFILIVLAKFYGFKFT